MKKVVYTVIAVLVLEAAALFGLIMSGIYNVAADSPDNPVIAWIVKNTRESSVEARAESVQVPSDLGKPGMVEEGAHEYANHCAGCHLAPGMEPTGTHRGMDPKPPVFAEMTGSPDPKEAFWIIKNGIKMTGMPAWGDTLDDNKIWPLAAFLQELPKLSQDQYQALTHGNAPAGGSEGNPSATSQGAPQSSPPASGGGQSQPDSSY
jgi:mono/diheme cytochrome c family protein